MSWKDTIIHESMKLFSISGFLNTGISDILKAANTSKGGFYNHFSSKEELFYSVLEEAQKIWRKQVLTGIREIESPTEQVKQILYNYRDNYLKDIANFPGGCIFITLSIELDDQRPHMMAALNEGFIGFKDLIGTILENGITQGEYSEDIRAHNPCNLIFTGMLGASLLYSVDKSEMTLKMSIKSLTSYLDLHKL